MAEMLVSIKEDDTLIEVIRLIPDKFLVTKQYDDLISLVKIVESTVGTLNYRLNLIMDK